MLYKIYSLLLMLFSTVSLKAADGLAFYLVDNAPNLREMHQLRLNDLQLHKLHLEGAPLVTQQGIVSYSKSNQSMTLTDASLSKLQQFRRSGCIGRVFAACVDGKPVYLGRVWSDIEGAGCSEIVLMIPVNDDNEVYLQAGYPTPAWFVGHDYRSSNLIIQALKRAGKLRK